MGHSGSLKIKRFVGEFGLLVCLETLAAKFRTEGWLWVQEHTYTVLI